MTILIPTKLLEEISDREFDIGQRVRGTTLAKFADHANQQCFRESLWSFNISFLNDYDTTSDYTGGNPSLNIESTKTFYDNIGGGGEFATTATAPNEGGPTTTTRTYKIDLPQKSEAAESVGFILTYIAPGTAYHANLTSTPPTWTPTTDLSNIKLRLEKKTGTNTFTVVDPPSTSSENWAVELNDADATLPFNRILTDTDVYAGTFSANTFSTLTQTVTRSVNAGFRGRSFRVLRTIGSADLGDSDSTLPRRMHYNQAAGASGKFVVTIEYLAATPIELFVFEIPKITT